MTTTAAELEVACGVRAAAAADGDDVLKAQVLAGPADDACAAIPLPHAAALEDAAGVLLHAATAFISIEGPLPGLFAEQAGALLAVAARFEEAADLSRSGGHLEGEAPR